jgi:TPR repeat protein
MARTAAASGRHNVSDERNVCALQHNWSADVAEGHSRYHYGQGVSKDDDEARRWFHRAADLGNPE